jgi:N-acyl-D-amino-acid deacylase
LPLARRLKIAQHRGVKFLLCLIIAATCVRAETFDVIVRGGRVADGTGNPLFTADVAVRDGRIAAIGKISGTAERVIQARGKIVAPGFIDVHTHAEDIDDLPLAANFPRMGVTTLVLGNCGSSVLNVSNYFRRLEATNISVNVATLIGHGTVREKAMGGSFDRVPTTEEMERMREYVRRAMEEGAVGLSTGLIYLPGAFAKTDEIIELAKIASAHDGIYASHMRGEGREIFEALDEVFRIARGAGIRAEVSHIKLSGKSAWGEWEKVLGAIERARAEGLDITQDQYVYTASSTGISQLVPMEWREGGKFKERIADPKERKKLAAEMKATLKRGGRRDYSYAVIASYKHDRSLNGLNIAQAAKKKLGASSLDSQIDLILEIQANGGAQGIFHGISEDDLQHFLQHPNTMFASDSGVRRMNEGVPHPRGYGNNARVLAHYVRELKLLRMEDAVRRMTSLPATTFRLRDRGEVRLGNWADLVVFDPETVQDNATFDDPHHYATGFSAVLVNGVVVVENDKHTGARPGKTLRHASAGTCECGE